MENIGSGKTLASGPNDNVFVYFTDHGAKVSSAQETIYHIHMYV